jgi:hypothetical protein
VPAYHRPNYRLRQRQTSVESHPVVCISDPDEIITANYRPESRKLTKEAPTIFAPFRCVSGPRA